MEKIAIPEDLRGKDLFKFLRENKKSLIQQKKSVIKFTEPVLFFPIVFDSKKDVSAKSSGADIPEISPGIINVKAVMNTSLWIDEDMDLLLRDNATKSIKETKPLIKHLKNHGRTLDDEVGDINDIYYQDMPLKELGYDKMGTGQALIFDSNVKKSYDASTFDKYKSGRINQHSIGLKYVRLELAINDDEDEKEKDFWDKYYPSIINPEAVDEKGYFWVVPEIKLIEGSAVLFGSNRLTPTLNRSLGTQNAPGSTTHSAPPATEQTPGKSTSVQPAMELFDLDKAIREIKLFNPKSL